MYVLGIDCDKSGFSFVVLDRDEDASASLIADGHRLAPANSTRQGSLSWIHNEVLDLSSQFSPVVAGLKRADIGVNLSNSILEHAEVDGAVQAALGSLGTPCESLQWKSLASRLGSTSKPLALADLKSRQQFRNVARSRMAALGMALVAKTR